MCDVCVLVSPVVDRVYPLAEAQQAHEYMESNANTGKIVLSVIPPASPGVDNDQARADVAAFVGIAG